MYVLDEKHPQFPSPEAVNRSPSNVVAIHGNGEYADPLRAEHDPCRKDGAPQP